METNQQRQVIYEIFPRNYGINGNFTDIINDLDRIKSLGVDIIWLMPIHPIGVLSRKGSEGSPYSIQDYSKIHPDLGDEQDLSRLISEVHKRDMKIIIDAVLNHTSVDSDWVTSHPSYYLQNESGDIIRKVSDWSDILDLNYENQELWAAIANAMNGWVQMGIDGFRCDVAPMVPLEFWQYLKSTIDKDNELVWIAESVHLSHIRETRKSGDICHSDAELHSVFDFTYEYDSFELFEMVLKDKTKLVQYIYFIKNQMYQYPDHALKLRFLENHDIARAASIFDNFDQLKNWTVFTFYIPGASLVYAGQEYALKKLPNLFEKDVVDWENRDENFLIFFKQIIELSKEITASTLEFDIDDLGDSLVKIEWNHVQKTVIFLNLGREKKIYSVIENIKGKDLLENRDLSLKKGENLDKFPIIIQLSS